MKIPVLTFVADMGLVVAVFIVMGAGLMGARLPYRQPAINSEAYQLEAFPTGLAWYQYGRVSPFYSLSPMNDYVVSHDSGRTALLSKEVFDKGQFTSSLNQSKPYQLWETIQAYGGLATPRYWIKTGGMAVFYESSVDGLGTTTVTRLVKFSSPRWIEAQAMTVAYNASDSVTAHDGVVTITNPTVAGALRLTARLNQTISVDKKNQLVEVRAPVGQITDTLTLAIRIKGLMGEE